MLHPSLFREYDIRGVYGETLHDADAYAIGHAFARTAAARTASPRICVGRDGRESSPALHDALCQGLADAGAVVWRTGLGPTPMLYYAVHTLNADGGIMVTGSHNPPTHNGFKFMLGSAPFFGQDIQKLRPLAQAAPPPPARFAQEEEAGLATRVRGAYEDTLVDAAPHHGRALTVAWDAGNGAAGEVMAAVCARLPGRHIVMNEEIDGTFPAHHPDPTVPENLEQLIEAVRKQKADCGIAFDGDADRIGVVDDEGEILWGDQLLMLYATDVLRHMPGATVIADVKASQALFDEVKRLGGTPLMWKTGHSHIKAKMKQTGAPLAGEMSGHVFFADRYFGFDDGLYAAMRLLAILSDMKQPLSAWRKAMPKTASTPEIRFPCAEERKFAVIEEVKSRLASARADVNDVDGVRVQTPDGWWLLRASNTQAVLVARCESSSMEGLERLKAALGAELEKSGVQIPA